jgi:hypothetical protein
MTLGALRGPSSKILAASFVRAVKEIYPDFSEARIAANVGESRQNLARALASSVSADRVISWILRWNEAHPDAKVRLVVKNEADLEVQPKAKT